MLTTDPCRYDIVPVVLGGGDYAHSAPPGSYIDALAFPTVARLAEYLLYLDANDTAYNEYFRWVLKSSLFVK